MSAILAIWKRELRAILSSPVSMGVVAAFFAATGWALVMLLRQCEGSVLQIQAVWAIALAPWLPIFASLLTVRLFAGERESQMIDLLLSAPIRERSLVLGKFLAAFTALFFTLALSLAVPLGILPLLSRPIASATHLSAFLPATLILLLQGMVWCAFGTMISSFFRHTVSAAAISLLLCGGAPVAMYLVAMASLPTWRETWPDLPQLTHVYEFSTGYFSLSVVLAYLILTWLCLFVCSKRIASLRLDFH